MIYINNNLQKINNLSSIFENIFGTFYICQKLKEKNIEYSLYYNSYIFKTFLKNTPLAKYNIYIDDTLFDKNQTIYLLNPTIEEILKYIEEKNIIFDIFFNIYDFSFYKYIDELDIKKILYNTITESQQNIIKYKRLIYITNLENIDKIFEFKDSYIIYNHINDSDIISILTNKMSTLNGKIMQDYINKNKSKLSEKNIKILSVLNNIYEYYEKLFMILLFADEIIIDLNRFTIWLLKLRTKNTIIKSNLFKIDYECKFCTYLYPKNLNIEDTKSRIIYDASQLDGIGTIFYNLLMLMNDYRDNDIYLLEDFIPEHEKNITLKKIFPNLKFINKNKLHKFISINYVMSILTYINVHDIHKHGYDIIFTGTNFAFKPIDYKYIIKNHNNMISINSDIIKNIKSKYNNFFDNKDIKIAVHIRRGDYLKYLSANPDSFVCLLEDSYYIDSINKIINTINTINKPYHIYFFAEDNETIEHVKNKILLKIDQKIDSNKYTIIPLDVGINHIYLLSNCNYIIMSSSTFSLAGLIFNKLYNDNNDNDITIISPNHFTNPRSNRDRYYKQKTIGILDIIKTSTKKYDIINIKCASHI